MKKLTIAFDVDGVLRDLHGFTVAYLNDNGFLDPPRKVEDLNYYGAFLELFKNKDQWRETLNETYAWRDSPPFEAMREVFQKLRGMGHDCIIVTSNSRPEGQRQTIDWICNNLTGAGLDVHFVNDKLSVKYDVIFEDMPKNAAVASENGRLAFLVKRPWSDLENQKSGPDGEIVTKWNPKLLTQLPDDEEAMAVIEHKLAWFEGWREAAVVFLKAKAGID